MDSQSRPPCARLHQILMSCLTLYAITKVCRFWVTQSCPFSPAGAVREMREAGLYLVYMGLESGTEEGLKTLHKQISVEQNIAAVDTLKQLGILFEFGFMLFDPSSTFQSVRQNIAFLRRIVGDGSAGA